MASAIKPTQRRLEEQGYTQKKGPKAPAGKGKDAPMKSVKKPKKGVTYGK